MKYLFVKFFRDIKKLWPQFFSVLIMAMISTTIFTGMSSVWVSMENVSDDYFADCNLADAWLYSSSISENDLNKIRELPYVDSAARSFSFTGSVAEDNDASQNSSDLLFTTINNDTFSVLSPLLRDGEALSTEKNGIWIDEDYAKENDIAVGESIIFTYSGISTSVKVLGTVLDAENIFFIVDSTDTMPNHKKHGYAYISEQLVQELLGEFPYTQGRISVSEHVDTKLICSDLSEILGQNYIKTLMRNDIPTINQLNKESEQIRKMALLFSAIFILLSVLTMYTTMSRLVDNQTIQIGSFKALGFNNSQINFHYMLYGFSVAVIGGGLGHILGLTLVSPLILNVKKTTLTLPVWNKPLSAAAIILWLIIISICMLSTLLTVHKIIKAVPAETIKGNVPGRKSSAKSFKPSKLSYAWLWTIRGIGLHKARFAMGVIAVIGSLVLMTAGLGVMDSINNSTDAIYSEEYSYDYAASIKPEQLEEATNLLSNESVQYASTLTVQCSSSNKTLRRAVTILSDGEFVHLYENNVPIDISKMGVCITKRLANELDIKSGDIIEIYEAGSDNSKIYTIDHIVDAMSPQGLFMSIDTWCNGYENVISSDNYSLSDWNRFIPSSVYMSYNTVNRISDLSCFSSLISLEEQRDNSDSILESVRSIMLILIFAAFVLAAVVLYNLGTLSFIERYREYATMKVLGFYKNELRGMVLKDGLITLIIGLILGIPASKAFLGIYIGTVQMESMEWSPYIHPIKFILILTAVSIFSIGINLIVAHKIRKVDMVEAMKSTD